MNSTSPLAYYEFSMESADILMGITFNTILLVLIKRFSSAYLGNYKYLLAAFALFDIFLCTLHGLLNPELTSFCLVEVHKALRLIHDQPIYDGWMAMDHWRDGKLNTNLIYMIAITMTIIFGSFSTAATLATRTYLHILRATTLSTKHRTTQITLLIAVCAQTFVPLVCVYIPYFMCIMSPFLSLSGFGMVDHFPLLLSIFPGWDALVIVVLIKDYRMGLAKMLGWKRKPETSILVNHTQFTTSVQASAVHQQ